MSSPESDQTNEEGPSRVEELGTTAIDIFDSIQRYLALFFLIAGLAMLIVGIIAASTEWFTATFEMSVYEAWRVAGIFAGLGLPMIMIGVFTVLPATNTQRLGAGVGLALVIVGVVLFAMNFPNQWYGDEVDRTFIVVATYFTGAMLTLFYLFLSVANFQTPVPSAPTVPSAPEMPSTPSYPRAGGEEETDAAMETENPEQIEDPQVVQSEVEMRNQNPQTAATLLKSIFGLLFNARNDPQKEEIENIDIDEIMDAIEEHYGDEMIDSIQEIDDHIVIERSDRVRDAEFRKQVPQYVSVVDQKKRKYALTPDEATFYFMHKYEPDR